MSKTIKIKKGFNINLAGKAALQLGQCEQPATFALKPAEFPGLERPKLLVAEGDKVKAGTPLMYNKMQEKVMFCSPVSGEVAKIVRGAKRKLLEIRILADKANDYVEFEKLSISDITKLDVEKAKDLMVKSGVWPNIIQRPFGVIANPDDTPKSIFISSFDTHPLAPDFDFAFKGQEAYLQAGINVLKKFTNGNVYLGLDGNNEVSSLFSHMKQVETFKVAGPHPAGNVGTHIHFVDPINKGDLVWTVQPAGLVQIGKLFLEGIYDTEKVICLAGSEVSKPQYYKSYSGACISTFVKNNVKDGELRYISGNVLTGASVGSEGYLGFYDQLITVIPEGNHSEFLGWILPTTKKLSFHRAFGLLSFLNNKKSFTIDTNTKGEKRAFVQTGVFERVTPIDVLPTYLLKAILAEDYDEMESLGIYEVIEEDLALCEFVDVSKHDVQAILRQGLELIQNS